MRVYVQYDEDQLPVCVADSVKELSEKSGFSPIAIRASAQRAKAGSEDTRFRFVEVDDE